MRSDGRVTEPITGPRSAALGAAQRRGQRCACGSGCEVRRMWRGALLLIGPIGFGCVAKLGRMLRRIKGKPPVAGPRRSVFTRPNGGNVAWQAHWTGWWCWI